MNQTNNRIREEFRKKFGQFYVSIDSKTKAIRIVDIENGLKVNGEDGSLIECVASGDIEKWLDSKIDELLKSQREDLVEKLEEYKLYYNPIGDDINKGRRLACDDILYLIKEQ